MTLRAVADAFVAPSPTLAASHPSAGLSASAAGVDVALARVVEEYLSESEAAQLRQLLRLLEQPLGLLLLTGRPARFGRLDATARERFLLGWADSRLEVKRRAFRALKRLVLFLYYAPESGAPSSAVWSDLGYAPVEAPVGPVAPSPVLPPTVRLPPGGDLTTDVCIVGSGAGGSVVAARLATAGLRVLVVEAGPDLARAAFPLGEGAGFDRLYHSHGLLGTKDQAFSVLAGTVVGGSTTVNWMTCLEPEPPVRAEWERLGMDGAAGADLDRRIAGVRARLHVTREESQQNANNAVLARGCAALGFEEGVDYETIPRNALGCASRCQPCSFGCPYGAKQSAAETYLKDARLAGAQLLCDARVERVRLERGQVRGVEGRLHDGGEGRPFRVVARVVVVAGGAIESPALLLRSGLRGAVGRGLHLHPTSAVLGVHATPIRMWEGPMQTVVVRRWQRRDPARRAAWLESTPAHPGLAAQAAPWRGSEDHRRLMLSLERASATIALVRDRTPGRVLVDATGAAVVDYAMGQEDREQLTLGLLEAARLQRAAGAQRVATLHNRGPSAGDGASPIPAQAFDAFLEEVRHEGIRPNAVGLFSAHPTGSLPLGPDGSGSATDPSGRVWGVEGLWVADGSLLPSAPGVNPMLSIAAVADRTADRLLADLRRTGGTKR